MKFGLFLVKVVFIVLFVCIFVLPCFHAVDCSGMCVPVDNHFCSDEATLNQSTV